METMVQNRVSERIEKFVDDYVTRDIDMSYEQRRKYPRYPMTESVDVMIDSFEAPAEMIQATGRDVSSGGLGIYSHRPIPEGTEMLLNIDNGKGRLLTKAVAVHSTLSVGLFKVGTRFTM